VITGSDDLTIRVFNYNTLEKVASFDGHADFIRDFAVHPVKPIVLSCSDDMSIKGWDWEKGWKATMVYEGHQHYVMSVVFNPKDPNTFASASLDRTVKVWSLNSTRANYTLEGHEKGVNALDYYHGADKPYLVTASDDLTCRVWDLQSKACVRVLEGHTMGVTSVMFHPGLPIIISGSEDCSLKVYNANTFRLESSFSMSLDRIWSISYALIGTQDIAIGCDEGVAVIQVSSKSSVSRSNLFVAGQGKSEC
jgi:coatomer subunit beta'